MQFPLCCFIFSFCFALQIVALSKITLSYPGSGARRPRRGKGGGGSPEGASGEPVRGSPRHPLALAERAAPSCTLLRYRTHAPSGLHLIRQPSAATFPSRGRLLGAAPASSGPSGAGMPDVPSKRYKFPPSASICTKKPPSAKCGEWREAQSVSGLSPGAGP